MPILHNFHRLKIKFGLVPDNLGSMDLAWKLHKLYLDGVLEDLLG